MSEIPKFNQDMFVDLGDGVCEQNYGCNEKIFPFCFHFIHFLKELTFPTFGIKVFIRQFFLGGGM